MRRTAYQFLASSVALLILYAIVRLLGGLNFLGADPLAALPFQQIDAFGRVLLDLAVLGGLLGGGLYIGAEAAVSVAPLSERLSRVALIIWVIGLALIVIGGFFGVLGGSHGRELPALLSLIVIAVVVLVIVAAARAWDSWTAIAVVWTAAMILVVIARLIAFVPAADFDSEIVLTTLSVGLRINIGYALASAALIFWLMRRFSAVMPLWAEMGMYTVAGLLALAGALLTLAGLQTALPSDALRAIGTIAAFAVPLLYLIFAAHAYNAFSQRSPNVTLSAHWTALAVVLLTGASILGGLAAYPGVRLWIAGTLVDELQPALMLLAFAAVILGMANQVSADLRGENRRITGFIPFWLAAFGMIGGGLALLGAGVVQVYLERLLSVGFLETQTLIIPLYSLWWAGLVGFALALLVYALAFWLRRPRFDGSRG